MDRVKAFYKNNTKEEWDRLFKDPFHNLEWRTTWHYLDRYLPKKGLILDAGGGPGRYSIELAKRGYRIVLLDLTPELLEMARKKAKRQGVLDRIEFVEGTIEDLPFDDNTFDAVLCLGGVMSHLVKKKKRVKAANELVRVLKPGKPLFVSVIGRLHIPMQVTRKPDYYPEMLENERVFYKYILHGEYNGEYGFAPAYFYDPEKLVDEFKDSLRVERLIGLEGIYSPNPDAYNIAYRKKKYRESLWKLHLKTCEDPCVVSVSQHFMLIGKKPKWIKISQ